LRKFLIAAALALEAGCGPTHSSGNSKQVIVIGVDGMDPGFVERHWNDLPNLAQLRRRGGFARLATTTPPQSPVAWSTFITGLDSAEHGIFDFVHRDPATLEPFSSMDKTEEPRFVLPFGPYRLPISPARVTLLRKGKAFWQTLTEHDIPVTIIRIPLNYPPLPSGEALSGMGVPDLRGTQGTFSFYTDDPGEMTGPVDGGVIVKTALMNGRAELSVEGPPDSLRKDRRPSSAAMTVDVDPELPFARIVLGEETAIVKQGEWSDWIPAEFPLIPHIASVRGMVRVFAKQLHPRFELYVSPVNIDPEAPSLPISTPARFSREIAAAIGRYPTLGIPEDTAALRQGVFNLDQFVAASRIELADEQRLLRESLRRYRGGLLFFYFSSIDQNSHILWGQHDAQLLKFYRAIDDSIGEVARNAPSAELMIMSDHGFAAFDRAVNLNAWLRDQGLLAMHDADHIDWSRTQAYALGLNGLYLNLAGREKYGIVRPGVEQRALLEKIRAQLLSFRDPQGRTVVETAVPMHSPANATVAPDLIVGYAPGYRASWRTALGQTAEVEIEDNIDAWIADHCINAADVPGVVLTGRPMRVPDPALKDLPVSILALFGIAPEPEMRGRSIY
jgi:predicted AlkP superfamily phosphohydrolase/phosphomutase